LTLRQCPIPPWPSRLIGSMHPSVACGLLALATRTKRLVGSSSPSNGSSSLSSFGTKVRAKTSRRMNRKETRRDDGTAGLRQGGSGSVSASSPGHR
jgi:hypothetical protein